MNFTLLIDWKFIVALGTAAAGIILSVKVNSESAEKVLIHAVDACKEYVVAGNSDR